MIWQGSVLCLTLVSSQISIIECGILIKKGLYAHERIQNNISHIARRIWAIHRMRASSKIIIKRRSWPIRTSWLAEEKFENRNTAMPSIRFFCLLSRPPTTLLKILVPFNTNRPLVRSPQARPHPLQKHVWVGDDFHAINKLYVSSWVFFFRATLHIGRRCWCR